MAVEKMVNRMYYIYVRPIYIRGGSRVNLTVESVVVAAGSVSSGGEVVTSYAPITSGHTGDTTRSTFGDNNRNREFTTDVWCLYGQYVSFQLMRAALVKVLEEYPRNSVSISERINVDLEVTPSF